MNFIKIVIAFLVILLSINNSFSTESTSFNSDANSYNADAYLSDIKSPDDNCDET